MAEYKILVDSSCELPAEYKADDRFVQVPFRFIIDGVPLSAKNLDPLVLMDRISGREACSRSACPSPDTFLRNIKGEAKRVYIVTQATVLSGCYRSAMLAKEMYEKEMSDKEIMVIDATSASGAESRLVMAIVEMEEKGLDFESIKEALEQMKASERDFYFLKGNVTENMAKIKSTTFTAFDQLCEAVSGYIRESAPERIIITHCGDSDCAEMLRDALCKLSQSTNVIIMKASSLSSFYAHNGGIVLSVAC